MTPAQEAKEYAAQHGFSIVPDGRRYRISHGDNSFATVGGYPAVLNAMKRYLETNAVGADSKTMLQMVDAEMIVGSTKFKIIDVVYPPASSDFPFEDDASKARIRAEARRINKPAEGSPEWFARRPWRIVGNCYLSMAYATRSDALKTVRSVYAGRSDVSIVYMGA